MKKILILLIVVGIVAVISFLFYKEGTLPVNKNNTESTVFVIPKGSTVNTISNKLASENLIRSRLAFYLVIKEKGIEKQIQAGSFRLSQSMNAYEIADKLTHGTLDKWVTIREGLRKEEIAEILSREFQIPTVEFIALAEEGYLYPDTYLFPMEASAQGAINRLRSTLEQKYTEEMQQKARAKGLTKNQVLTMASLVEREASGANDRQQVANVIYKRFTIGMPLQIDATVQYALGYNVESQTWWKPALSLDDLTFDSPYNTYTNPGLPPAPISNPGIDSISAVVNADSDTPYLFYIHAPNGKAYFAEDYEGHQENIRKYLR